MVQTLIKDKQHEQEVKKRKNFEGKMNPEETKIIS